MQISQVRELDQRSKGAFVKRTFTEAEKEDAKTAQDLYTFYAGRFAVKEAVFKAVAHLTAEKAFDLRMVETRRLPDGRPKVTCEGRFGEILDRAGVDDILVSISNEGEYAIAIAEAVGCLPSLRDERRFREKKERFHMSYKIFAINPGSTSTKIALIEDETVLFSKNVSHDAAKLAEFDGISAQMPYRKETILNLLKENNISLDGVSAFVGRGGGLLPMEGGTYRIDATLLDHAVRGANGVQHPAQLGPQLANEFAREYNCPAFVVNPPDVDELQDLARLTGIKGVNRMVHLHALNLKETAIRHAQSQGKKYEEQNYVVCHIGGGISVSAHRNGKMVDGYDIVGGEGPMAPTRCGSVAVADLLRYAAGKDLKEVKSVCTRSGGLVSHLGTSDALEVSNRAEAGDAYAKMVWDTMIYQINKCIGSMAAVLHGKVDGILLGGGMVYNKGLVAQIEEACGWIAPVSAYPGEFEMEAMASGAIRVLSGEEEAKTYTGVPVWSGFDFEK